MRAQATEYLTAAEVMARFGVGRMWIERRTRDSAFPPPFKFGGRVSAVRRWRLSDLIAWESRWQRKAS